MSFLFIFFPISQRTTLSQNRKHLTVSVKLLAMFLEKIMRNVSHGRQVFITKGILNRWRESVILLFGNEMRVIYF